LACKGERFGALPQTPPKNFLGKIFVKQNSLAAFSLMAQLLRKSYKKETPKKIFALCGARAKPFVLLLFCGASGRGPTSLRQLFFRTAQIRSPFAIYLF
jgi:hypothetical protein